MRPNNQQYILKVVEVVEKVREANDRLSITTLQVQEAINRCNLPQWMKAVFLWIVAKTLRKSGVFSFLKTYLLIGVAYIVSRPSIWETIIKLIFDENNKARGTLLSIVQLFDGTIDYIIFGILTAVVFIVITFHFIINYQEKNVRKELENLINELTFNPEKEWFEKKCRLAIQTLGNRYSSEVNYKNPQLSNIYKVLVESEKWVLNFRKNLQMYVKECRHLYNGLTEPIRLQYGNIGDKISEIINIYNMHQYNMFATLFNDAKIIFDQFYDISYKSKDDVPSYKIDSLQELFRNIETNDAIYQFLSKPVLYVKGDAGTGKSHFLADIVNTRMRHHLKTLFALGLDFNQIGDVRERLMNIWGVKGTWDDFLNKLNKIGEIEKHRILIIIDGINEGLGNQIWPNVLAGIEADILQYPNLGLVISARTFSNTNMLDDISKDKATITLEGFRGMEDEAITYLTSKFGLTMPQISRYRKEFANPLFLKLYCQAYNNTKNSIPNSFLDVVINYLDKINEKLAPKYGYQATLYNYTREIANLLTELYVSQTTKQMVKFQKFEDLLAKAESILPDGWARDYLQDLVSEGMLINYINKDQEILVDFNFDLVSDYMYAAVLINKQWKEYIGRVYDNGIYEATCVLLPHMKGFEIFDYTITNLSLEFRQDLFVNTLKHRFFISNSAIDEIKKIKTIDINLFYEILPILVTHPECHSIIDMVNTELKCMSMVERDQKWSMHFTIDCYDPAKTELVNFSKWAASILRKSASVMPDIITYQGACVLIWGFSSPYRLLRDVATKAAINLLQDKPQVLIRVVDFFDDVNDPYIQQRLYAVVHGCVFRGNCCTSTALGEKVFEAVFETGTVRPDILLRDYARCAIDYINQHNEIKNIDITKIEPPYGSKFDFSQCPDRDTIEHKYRLNKSMGFSESTVYTQNKILDSMETEYSNGTGGYGDFGRYVFESYLHRWEDCNGYSAPLLRNYALGLIFEKYKFNPNIYQRHDSISNYHRGNRPVMERFGKKFQWIALYEILGLLQDNYQMESWVSNDKNVQCVGTWDPHVRDIDTTNTFTNYYNDNYSMPKGEILEWTHISSMPFKVEHEREWLSSNEGMSKELVSKSIFVKDNFGDEWIVLYGYNIMTPETMILQIDENEVGLWEFIQAYLVPRKQRNNVAKLINKKGTQGRVMPEYRNDIYNLFYKDYYCSASYREYAQRTNMDDWKNFDDKRSTYQIGYLPYACEGEMTVYRLNKQLFEILNLKDGEKDGEYVDETGRIVAFDPSVKYENDGQLLVRKKEMLIALKDNNLSLVWPVLLEKQRGTSVIGYQFGGSAMLTDRGKIKVRMRLYKERLHAPKKNIKKVMLEDYAKLIWYIISFKKTKKMRMQMKIKMSKMGEI